MNCKKKSEHIGCLVREFHRIPTGTALFLSLYLNDTSFERIWQEIHFYSLHSSFKNYSQSVLSHTMTTHLFELPIELLEIIFKYSDEKSVLAMRNEREIPVEPENLIPSIQILEIVAGPRSRRYRTECVFSNQHLANEKWVKIQKIK